MLYYLSSFSEYFKVLNVFKYLTFRTGGALLTALFLGIYIGPRIIVWLKKKQKEGQPIRKDGPETHLAKQGTPTMGGLILLLSALISSLLWVNPANMYVWGAFFVTLGFGALGFLDDYQKLVKRSHLGVSGKMRLVIEALLALGAYFWIANLNPDTANILDVPFFKNVTFDLGAVYAVFVIFVIVGAANAVNFTDGLDGLASGAMAIALFVFMLIAYLVGHALYAKYLFLIYLPGVGELAVFAGALIGACLSFLWFNATPAKVFMGDTGSLALGAAIGYVAVATKHEVALAIAGGLFVMETLSVILQVSYFKATKGKRLFKMAPIHHHFEKKGWSEQQVVIRFWIICIVFALLSLSTLKLR